MLLHSLLCDNICIKPHSFSSELKYWNRKFSTKLPSTYLLQTIIPNIIPISSLVLPHQLLPQNLLVVCFAEFLPSCFSSGGEVCVNLG